MDRKQIWYYLRSKGCTPAGAAAIMGNIQAESAFRSNNLQDCYNSNLGYSDEGYTAAVDRGSYGNFVYDAAGYGLCQWTYFSRKGNLLAFAKNRGTSIADAEMQLDFMEKEMKEAYYGLWRDLCERNDVSNLAIEYMVRFENPADKSITAKQYRAGLAQAIYAEFAEMPVEQPSEDEEKPQVVHLMRNISVPELCIGTHCEAVRALQALLAAKGYACAADGIFGGETKTALEAFQRETGLGADGICGKDTWATLINGG